MKKILILFGVLAATSAGAATIKVRSDKWGDVNFPHRVHVQKAKVVCSECHYWDSDHDMATKVGHGPCKGCHIERKGPVFCRDCHTRKK